jgi:hypothetical protein
MRWTRQRWACMRLQGGFPVSDQRHADEKCLQRTAKSCGPDAPALASSWRNFASPTGQTKSHPQATVTISRSPRRARRKPLKPSCVGMPGQPGKPAATTLVCFLHFAHEAAGASAPGIPHALCFLWAQRSRTARADSVAGMVELCLRGCLKAESLSANARRALFLLPLWEKVARTQSATDEGSASADRTPHPNPLPIEVGYIRLRQFKGPTRVNPSWVGEGAYRRCRDIDASIQVNRQRDSPYCFLRRSTGAATAATAALSPSPRQRRISTASTG